MPRGPRMGESGALGNRHRYSARQENSSANQILDRSHAPTGALSGLELLGHLPILWQGSTARQRMCHTAPWILRNSRAWSRIGWLGVIFRRRANKYRPFEVLQTGKKLWNSSRNQRVALVTIMNIPAFRPLTRIIHEYARALA